MKLRHHGIKGHNRELDLAKLNLITGANGVGKTTIRQSLHVLFLGYDPSLPGKTHQDTIALAANGQIDISLALDSDRVLSRSIKRKGTSVTMAAECSWLRQATPMEHHDAILKLAGREKKEALENLWARGLLDLSPNDKAKVMEGILSAGKKTPNELALLTARLTVERLTGIKELTERNYKSAVDTLPEAQQASLKMLAPMLEAKLAETGIPGAVTWANAEKRRAALDLEGKEKAKVELETRLGDSTDVPQSEIDALEAEKEKLQKEIGAAEERDAQARRRSQAIREAKQEMDFAQTRYESAVVESQKLIGAKPISADDLESEACRKLDTLGQLKLELVPDPKYAEMKVADIKNEVELATNSPWGEVKEIGQWLKRQREDSVSARGTRLIQIAAKYLKGIDPEALAGELQKAEEELAREQEACIAATDRNYDIQAKKMKLKAEAEDLRRRAQEARKAEREGERIARALEVATSSYEAARKRFNDLAKMEPVGDTEGSAFELERLAEINKKLTYLLDAAATRRQLTLIITAIGDLSALRDVFSAVEWALQRVRESELNESGGPLMAHIEKFLKAAGRKETPYFEASRTDFEIGWVDEQRRKVAIQVMSGAEQALFTAAFHAAVIALRKPPLKVLIVEAGEATRETLEALLNGIYAVHESLDLALVLTHHDVEQGDFGTWNNEDWKVTRLGN